MKYKQGDIIKNEDGKRKILGICGEVYFLSFDNDFSHSCGNNYTNTDLEDMGYKLALVKESKWKPKKGELYWYMCYDGIFEKVVWFNDNFDNKCYNIGNCFKSKDDPRIEEYKQKLLNLGKE